MSTWYFLIDVCLKGSDKPVIIFIETTKNNRKFDLDISNLGIVITITILYHVNTFFINF